MAKPNYSKNTFVKRYEASKSYGSVHFSGYGDNLSTTKLDRASKQARSMEHATILPVIKIVFAIILLSVVFSALNQSQQTITFSSFLEWLQNFHPAINGVTYTSNIIGGDWGLFEFLRTFLNLFITVFDFLLFVCKNLVNLISYIMGFFTYLFSA